MRITVKTKIWITVLSVVLLFTLFLLFYLPSVQGKYLLNNYNKEVQNHAHTVALGVKIAITEQNYQGVQTAMEFVKGDTSMVFVSLLQTDTTWNADMTNYSIKKTVFKTFPENFKVDINARSNDSIIYKRSAFETPMMNGEILLGFKTTEIVQSKKAIRNTSLFFSSVVLIFGILVGFWLSKKISVPVLELRDAALKVGKGDLTQRVVCNTHDEIGELGTAFNRMVDDLGKARRELEERTRDLQNEKKKSDELLTDLQETFANLKETQEQLIRQEKFASIGQLTKGIVDRILNPLNYINNFSLISKDLLQEIEDATRGAKETIEPDKYDELVDLIDMVNTNMEKIHEHGSSASRIVKGMEKLLKEKSTDFIEADINRLVESHVEIALQESKLEYPNLKVDLVTSFDPTHPRIKVLAVETGEVIYNLVANSLYSLTEKAKLNQHFSPQLIIKTEADDDKIMIRVKDNGKGISRNEVDHLFSPFFTTKPTAKGTGLGLYLSQDIIKLHKGNISVDTIEGEYTEFTVTIPILK